MGVGFVLICRELFVKILYFGMVAHPFSHGISQGLGSVPLEDGANALEETAGDCGGVSVGLDLFGHCIGVFGVNPPFHYMVD